MKRSIKKSVVIVLVKFIEASDRFVMKLERENSVKNSSFKSGFVSAYYATKGV